MPKAQDLDTEQDRREEDCPLGSCLNLGRVSIDGVSTCPEGKNERQSCNGKSKGNLRTTLEAPASSAFWSSSRKIPPPAG
jgi:hypothetical protein